MLTKHVTIPRDTNGYHRVSKPAQTHCTQAALPTFINPFIVWFITLTTITSPCTGQ